MIEAAAGSELAVAVSVAVVESEPVVAVVVAGSELAVVAAAAVSVAG